MARLIFGAITSLDGYIEDESGNFDWAFPSEEVHQFANDLERPIGTYLYGRRMYETMTYWATPEASAGEPIERDYAALWQAADKVVYSKSLESATTPKTRIAREFDVEAVRALKAEATSDISIGGPDLAGQALRAGLVDELYLLITPVIVGGGKPSLPSGVLMNLELLDQRRFANGTTYLRYRSPAVG